MLDYSTFTHIKLFLSIRNFIVFSKSYVWPVKKGYFNLACDPHQLYVLTGKHSTRHTELQHCVTQPRGGAATAPAAHQHTSLQPGLDVLSSGETVLPARQSWLPSKQPCSLRIMNHLSETHLGEASSFLTKKKMILGWVVPFPCSFLQVGGKQWGCLLWTENKHSQQKVHMYSTQVTKSHLFSNAKELHCLYKTQITWDEEHIPKHMTNIETSLFWSSTARANTNQGHFSPGQPECTEHPHELFLSF